MRKTSRKVLSIILSVLMVFSTLTVGFVTASAEEQTMYTIEMRIYTCRECVSRKESSTVFYVQALGVDDKVYRTGSLTQYIGESTFDNVDQTTSETNMFYGDKWNSCETASEVATYSVGGGVHESGYNYVAGSSVKCDKNTTEHSYGSNYSYVVTMKIPTVPKQIGFRTNYDDSDRLAERRICVYCNYVKIDGTVVAGSTENRGCCGCWNITKVDCSGTNKETDYESPSLIKEDEDPEKPFVPELPTYTVTFTGMKDADGNALTDVLKDVTYGDAATEPTGYATVAKAADKHYKFTGWDKEFSVITGNLTVTAQYSEEAHDFVSQGLTVTGSQADGFTLTTEETFICGDNDCKKEKTETIDLNQDFNDAANAAYAILSNPDDKYNEQSDVFKALKAAYDVLVNTTKDSSEHIKEKIAAVKADVETFEKAAEEDPGSVYSSFKVTFLVDGVAYATPSFNVGDAIKVPETDPTKDGYTFKGWINEEYALSDYDESGMPAEDLEFAADWETTEYTGYLDGIHGVVDGAYTITFTVETTTEELIALANEALGATQTGFTATAADVGYELDYKYTLTGWTPSSGAGTVDEQHFTAVYTKGEFDDADYDAWNEAVAAADELLEEVTEGGVCIYDEEKVIDAINEIKDTVEEDWGKSKQDDIDTATALLNALLDQIKEDPSDYYRYFDVYFDTNGGTPATLTKKSVKYLDTVSASTETFTKAGYKFSKWLLDGEEFDFTTQITGEITLTADYDIATYTATFYKYKFDAETNEVAFTDTYQTVGDDAMTFAAFKDAHKSDVPAQTGSTGAWDWNGVTFGGDFDVYPTYTANTYNIYYYQYEADKGNTEKLIGSTTYTFGETKDEVFAKFTEPDVPERDGYNGAWQNIVSLGADDVYVYAVYTHILYTATYYKAEEGNDVLTTVNYYIDSESVNYPEVPEKAGYDGKWYTEDWFVAGETLGDKEIRPVFTPKEDIPVEVTCVSTSGKELGGFTLENQTMDTEVTIDEQTATDNGFATPAGYKAPEAQNLTIKASGNTAILTYEPIEYTATYFADEEGTTPLKDGDADAKLTFTVETSLQTLTEAFTVPAREGYKDGAWDIDEVPAEDMKICPTYSAETYTISFTDDSGEAATADYTFESFDKAAILAAAGTPTARTGYTVEWPDDQIVKKAMNYEIKAVYTAIPYTVSYKYEETTYGTATFTVEDSTVATSAITGTLPEKEGYTFTWPTFTVTDELKADPKDAEIEITSEPIQYDAKFVDEQGVDVGEAVKYTIEDTAEAIITRAAKEVPAKSGYDKGEWVLVGGEVVIDGITFTATYKDEDLTKYTLILKDLNGDQIGDAVEFTIKNVEEKFAEAASAEKLPDLTAQGYDTAWSSFTFDPATKEYEVRIVKNAKTYTATFKTASTTSRADAQPTFAADESLAIEYTVESELAALQAAVALYAPADYELGDRTCKFTGWDKEFALTVGGATYTAEYEDYDFDPANYDDFNEAIEKLNDLIKDKDLLESIEKAIEELIADGYKNGQVPEDVETAQKTEDVAYGITDQDAVDAAADAILAYILETLDKDGDGELDEDAEKPDYTAYDETLAALEKLLEEVKAAGETLKDGVEEDIKKITDTIDALKKDETATKKDDQKTVDDATQALQKIIDGIKDETLIEADFTGVDEAIDEYEDIEDIENVTDEIKDEIEDIKQKIEELKDDEETNKGEDQPTIDDLEKQIEDIIKEITDENGDLKDEYKKPDFTEYDKAVDAVDDAIDGLDEDEVLKDGVQDRIDELKENAEKIRAIEDATAAEYQDDIDAITEELKQIAGDIANKKLVEADFTGVDEAIGEYEDIEDIEEVTDDIKDKIEEIKEKIKELKEDEDTNKGEDQSTIDELEQQIKDIIEEISEEGKLKDEFTKPDFEKYDEAKDALDEIIENYDVDPEVLDQIKENDDTIEKLKEDPKANKKDDQEFIDDATDYLKDILDSLTKGEDKYLTRYTVTFLNGAETFAIVEGKKGFNALDALKAKMGEQTPEKAYDKTSHYTFKAWTCNSDLTNVTADTSASASYTSQKHSYDTALGHTDAGDYSFDGFECKCGAKAIRMTVLAEDKEGNAVSGAKVTVTDKSSGETVTSGTTGRDGKFTTGLLPEGEYSVVVVDETTWQKATGDVKIENDEDGNLKVTSDYKATCSQSTCGNCMCHSSSIFGKIVRFVCTILSNIFNRPIKCCDDMEYLGKLKF